MSEKLEILFLVHRIPYPPDKGDKIRSWRLLEHLAEQFSVHLACFVDDDRDFAHTEFLSEKCKSAAFIPLNPKVAKLKSAAALITGAPMSNAYYRDRAMEKAVAMMRARPLAAEVAFSSVMAQYIEKPMGRRQRIVDFCDADSEKWRQYADETRGPLAWIYAREGQRLAAAETKIANWADASFAITADEAALFNGRPGLSRAVRWWSNGVDADYFDPSAGFGAAAQTADVVFTGAMDYRANIDAIAGFVNGVWPQIRQGVGDASLMVVGANPPPQLRMLDGKDGIRVTGRVDDIRPWIDQAKLAIAPLRVARGLQNKVLEAMAMAKPVVATSQAAAGIEAVHGEAIVVADGPAAMADAVISLLHDRAQREKIGKAARETVMRNYNWNSQLSRFDKVLSSVLDDHSSSGSGASAPASAADERAAISECS